MKLIRLKKKNIFSLIAVIVCITTIVYTLNSFFDIYGILDSNLEKIKYKEIRFMYGERKILGDRYSLSSSGYGNNPPIGIAYQPYSKPDINNLVTKIADTDGKQQNTMPVKDQYINGKKSWIESYEDIEKYHTITSELKDLVDKDSYRENLGVYYVFNFDFTMDALKELSPVIEKTAEAQKTPKALITAVLFREMMFMGQEDLLDGLPFVGGKSMGICQIGVDNVRFNEKTIHGKDSVIFYKTDSEIKEMLMNPKQAVYFCAVQLRARGINQAGDEQIDLNKLDKDQIIKILEEYNQSKIIKTIGPIKTKARYAEETYKYYELFQKYYKLG